NNAIHALTVEKRWRRQFHLAFAGCCAAAAMLLVVGAPFFYQVLLVQLACALAMLDAALRIVSGLKWRLLDTSLLISVGALALLRIARMPLLVWYFGLDVDFLGFNNSALELGLLAAESLLTLGIITLVVAAIIGDTIATFRHQSERDGLTGLLNRRAFDAVAGAAAAKGGVVIFCDIDHFKQVNDRFGHQAGDDVICALAEIICKTGYPAGRIGGEEFALLVPGGSTQDGLDLAEMIRARFGATIHNGLPAGEAISASFGVADFAPGSAPSTFFAVADAALYEAKAGGRNRVEAADFTQTPMAAPPRQTRAA
ncbi:MAG TPA: GGDEF domain-containing protein, partial [Devosia sp.]|nr:GGDEF domain-containing protein [Devosia sp.]